MKFVMSFVACFLAVGAGHAQDSFPSKPITIVVPQQAGGGSDIVTRLVAQKMSAVLKQPVLVDNRTGAGGNIGTAYVARAKPDGYTLVMNGNSHVINPSLYANPRFDPDKDFVPVAMLARGTLLLVANPAFAPNSMAELVAVAKAAPGKTFYASPGSGTINHLAAVMLEQAAHVSFTHVPYKGAPASMTDVVSGQIPFAFAALASSVPYLESGKLKVLAVTNDERIASMPRVPTIKETVSGYSVTPWYGLFAPASTPEAIVGTLHQAANIALQDPALKDSLAKQGIIAAQDSREDFSTLVSREIPLWRKVVKESGARGE